MEIFNYITLAGILAVAGLIWKASARLTVIECELKHLKENLELRIEHSNTRYQENFERIKDAITPIPTDDRGTNSRRIKGDE
jgi:hypothetical protein